MYEVSCAYKDLKQDVHRTAPRFWPWRADAVATMTNGLDSMIVEASAGDEPDGIGTIMTLDEVDTRIARFVT